jgi:hypothetical protein
MLISRWIHLIIRNVSGKQCGESQDTRFMFNNVSPKIVAFMIYVEKYGTASRQATDDNMAHARCMLGDSAYRQDSECVILVTATVVNLLAPEFFKFF